jgi:multidrug efflux pump subunit AcrA (membrane-fusion protein)
MRSLLLSGILVGAALTLAGCAGSPKPDASPRPVAAAVITADYESVATAIEAPGSVQPRNRVTLSSQINGYVRTVHAQAGDPVRQGQILVTLDSREAESQKSATEASVQEANAALEEARKALQASQSMRDGARSASELAGTTLSRYQKLADARSVSPQELDEIRSRRDAAAADLAAGQTMVSAAEDRVRQVEARIAQANAQSRRADVVLGWTVVKAPAAGRIAQRLVDPGTAIFPGTPLLILESSGGSQVLASLPTMHSGAVSRGLAVRIVDTRGDSPTGRVAEIIPVSDPASHTLQFKVDLPDGFNALSGDFVRVQVPSGTRQALLVPKSSIRESGQLTGVFVVDAESKARFRLVKTASYDPERVEVLTGLEPGERVVLAPGSHITDGTTLEIPS